MYARSHAAVSLSVFNLYTNIYSLCSHACSLLSLHVHVSFGRLLPFYTS